MRVIPGQEQAIAERLSWARDHLETAEIGLEAALSEDARRSLHGAYIVVTFGRGVTDGIRRLRKYVEGFDTEWWPARAQALEDDVVARYCFEIRNDVLHNLRIIGQQVKTIYTATARLRVFETQEELDAARAQDDGSRNFSEFRIREVVRFTSSKGVKLPDDGAAATVCRQYLAALRYLMDEADDTFGAAAGAPGTPR